MSSDKVVNEGEASFIVSRNGLTVGSPVKADVVNGAAKVTYPLPAGTAAGEYSVVVQYQALRNFGSSLGTSKLTVTKVDLTLTVDSKKRAYGERNPSFTATYSGFVGTDSAASLGGAIAFSTDANLSSPAGKYRITASGVSSNNYNIKIVDGTLEVGKIALVVTADNKSSVYGAATPTLTASINGFVNGDTVAQLDGALALSTSGKNVGDNVITVGGLTSSRYDIAFKNGVWKVSPAALTVKVNDATKAYGQDNPSFSAGYTGFVSGETSAVLGGALKFDTVATKASGAGSYAVSASGLTSSNYTVAFVPGALKVTPVAVTVRADDKSMVAGAVLPTLTATVSGLANGDSSSVLGTPVLKTSATSVSSVGTYPITVSGMASPNYTITFVNGVLAVGVAPTTCEVTDDTSSSPLGDLLLKVLVKVSEEARKAADKADQDADKADEEVVKATDKYNKAKTADKAKEKKSVDAAKATAASLRATADSYDRIADAAEAKVVAAQPVAVKVECDDDSDQSGRGLWKIERVQLDCKTLKPTGKVETILDHSSFGKWEKNGKRFTAKDDWKDRANDGCWKIVMTFDGGKRIIESKPFEVKDKHVFRK